MLKTPVLFLIFNRLDTTRQVFAKIREAQPAQLFIGADGARPDKPGEAEKVAAVRQFVMDNIDWDCEVKTLFREQNLGCGIAPAQAITWFFEHVEQGIILEDDCLPDLSFFTFCENLLYYYKDNEQVMHISGSNFQMGKRRGEADYYFSCYPPGWGWAGWSRAWQHYDFELKQLNKEDLSLIFNKLGFTLSEKKFWIEAFDNVSQGKRADIWDLQWTFSIWAAGGIAISPQVNLISNIGFGADATHTLQTGSKVADLKTDTITEIVHPKAISIHYQADRYSFRVNVQNKSDSDNVLNELFSKTISRLTRFLLKLKTLIYASKS